MFETNPIGGPTNQPNYINAVLVVRGGIFSKLNPSVDAAIDLLKRLWEVEKAFGRDRKISSIRWGPRSLDLDLLAWGELQINNSELILPHPHLIERDFVLIPLAEAIKRKTDEPQRLSPQEGWEE